MKLHEITPWNWFRKEGAEASRHFPSDFFSADDPFHRMARLHQEVDRIFQEMMHDPGMPTQAESGAGASGKRRYMLQPKANIRELKDCFELALEIPGVDEQDLHIDLSGDTLIVKGEKQQERKEDEGEYHRMECSYGSFQRIFNLPDSVNKERIDATFKNGVLTLTLPKQEPAHKEPTLRHIEIKH